MHQNIYFQKEVWEAFQNETNKSTLLNNLLRSHYGLENPTPRHASNSSVPIPPKPNKPKSSVQSVNKINNLLKSVPGITLATELPKSQLKPNNGMCKIHQVNLDSYGYCLQKGCKYGR